MKAQKTYLERVKVRLPKSFFRFFRPFGESGFVLLTRCANRHFEMLFSGWQFIWQPAEANGCDAVGRKPNNRWRHRRLRDRPDRRCVVVAAKVFPAAGNPENVAAQVSPAEEFPVWAGKVGTKELDTGRTEIYSEYLRAFVFFVSLD